MKNDIEKLIGKDKYELFLTFSDYLKNNYLITELWDDGGKRWTYECKYRIGSRTLCAFYFRENTLGFLIIFGKAEREKFGNISENFLDSTRAIYNNTKTYHDGKWLWFDIKSDFFEDYKKLLSIKRKPNKR